jgi:hypothetical protein
MVSTMLQPLPWPTGSAAGVAHGNHTPMLSYDEALKRALEFNQQHPQPPIPHRTVTDYLKAPPGHPQFPAPKGR